MKSISISEAVAYWDCQKKWYMIYKEGEKLTSKILEFGTMAHKALETRVIPPEELYPQLKQAFNIKSWNNYFTNVFNEVDEVLKDYEVLDRELRLEYDGVKGVIDVVCKHKRSGDICLFDYKFTNDAKVYDDIYLDAQLKVYAYLYSQKSWVDISQLSAGYISIPRAELSAPEMLKNGKFSKAKGQPTTYKLYREAIEKSGQDIQDYADILADLKDKQYVRVVKSDVDEAKVSDVIKGLQLTAKDMEKGYVLENFNAYKCKSCEYCTICKYRS